MAISDKKHTTQAKDMINQLSILLRNGHIHNIENDAVLEAMMKFCDIVNPYIESEGFLKIDLIGDFFYLNDDRVRYPVEFLLNFDYLTEELIKREIGSVSFLSPLEMKSIKIFLNSFIKVADSSTPFDDMVLLLNDTDTITIDKLKKIKEEEINKRRIVKKTYFNAVSFTKGVMNKIKSDEKVSIRKAKRVIESIVDAVLSEEQLLIGMTSIKDYDEYTYHHSVNVSVLSIAIGQRIGLNKRDITALGVAALFHDMGKTGIPLEVLNKPSYLSEDEWRIMHKHPFWGALSILKLKGIDMVSMENAIVAFQHHMNHDFSGYPKLRESMDLSFYSKIISIADQYDAMTSSRIYHTKAMSPDKTLGIMMERSGSQIDPILFKFFINMVGKYPVGALVLLDTREMGLVYDGSHTASDRPRVMIVVNNSGSKVDGFVADLTETDTSGRFVRTIIKTLDPKDYGISLAEYIL